MPNSTKTLSRQRLHQLARQAAGLCILCPTPRVTKFFCLKHAIETREKNRRLKGSQRRYCSLTYRLETAGTATKVLRTEAAIKAHKAAIRELRQRLAA